MNLISGLRDLQQKIREIGLGMSTLALPAPKLLLLPYDDGSSKEEILFSQIVTEAEISDVSRDLFESGFYNQAVSEAFKALNKYIQEKSGKVDVSDTSLMNLVFSEKNPILEWSKRTITSEKDEQKGYMFLFSGSFTGIRNPCSHEIDWIDNHETALDAILLAQHLLRKARAASVRTQQI